MKILVTGSDGYLGIQLTQVLLEKGYDVTGLDTGYYRSGWLFNGVNRLPEVKSLDIRKIKQEDLNGIDSVIHLAELSNDPLGQTNPKITYDINHFGTRKLAQLSKTAGVKRFIYFSSCSVYGASDHLKSEESSTKPLTAYAECKVLNEKTLLRLSDDYFSPTILRLATAYGISPRMRFDLAINNLSGLAWTTKGIKLESDGSPWRPFVHVLDICDAVVAVLTAPISKIHNQIFNVGDNTSNYQIKDIAQIISQVYPGCKISLNKKGVDKRNYRVSFDKIQDVLGFSCKRNVEFGIKDMLRLFEDIDLQKETFEAKDYTRVKQISYLLKTKQLNSKYYWVNKNK